MPHTTKYLRKICPRRDSNAHLRTEIPTLYSIELQGLYILLNYFQNMIENQIVFIYFYLRKYQQHDINIKLHKNIFINKNNIKI